MPLTATRSSQDNGLLRAWAVIDLQALHHNISIVRKLAPHSRIIAVIKADAYGHGLPAITESICRQVDGFAVATLSEGILCRQVQDCRPIVVLSEFWRASQLADFERYDMQPVIHGRQQAGWLQAWSGKPLTVWVKCDTGMNRLGIPGRQLAKICASLQALESIQTVRVMSHLANADIPDDRYTDRQLETFESACSSLRYEKSLANSAGIMRWKDTRKDWIRPGLMLYGVSPFMDWETDNVDLRPVMQLKARLISVKPVDENQPIGYGGFYRTRRPSRIGIAALGYGDGYPRNVDAGGCVLIHGRRAPVAGRVSMDMIAVDVTDHETAEVGDEVTLWGDGLPVEEVAGWAQTIPYELLSKVTPRIPRIVTGDTQHG